jgi:hypothetical protein
MGGLIRHVKSVFWIGEELLSHPLYAPFTEDEKDEIRVAILLHDACKQGVENDGSHTAADHPLLVREALMPYNKYEDQVLLPDVVSAWSRICDLIETHMGIWTKDKDGNEILDVPKTKAQLFVHQCDFLASRSFIEVDVTPRDAQAGYGSKKEEPAWKKEIATGAQIGYIKKLYVTATQRGITYPATAFIGDDGNITLTKGEATEIIEAIKKQLGMS